jgi:Ca2+-binding EF-hand superfamily protein
LKSKHQEISQDEASKVAAAKMKATENANKLVSIKRVASQEDSDSNDLITLKAAEAKEADARAKKARSEQFKLEQIENDARAIVRIAYDAVNERVAELEVAEKKHVDQIGIHAAATAAATAKHAAAKNATQLRLEHVAANDLDEFYGRVDTFNRKLPVAIVFEAFDSNHDGKFGREEMKSCLSALWERIALQNEVDSIMEKYANGGIMGEIDKDTFTTLLNAGVFHQKGYQGSGSIEMDHNKFDYTMDTAHLLDLSDVAKAKDDIVITLLHEEYKIEQANAAKAKAAAESAVGAAAQEVVTKAALVQAKKGEEDRYVRIIADIKAGLWSSQRVFAAYDLDASGALDVAELDAALTCLLGMEISMEQAQKMMDKFDSNHDHVMEPNEFDELVAKAQEGGKNFFSDILGTKTTGKGKNNANANAKEKEKSHEQVIKEAHARAEEHEAGYHGA